VEVYVATPRMVLRRFTRDDVDLLAALDSDPNVMRYLSRTLTPRHAIEHEVLPGWIAEYAQAPGFGCWAALDSRSGEFLGWFSLRPKGHPGQAELGYRLRRAAWGQGLATEGGRALIDRAFGSLAVSRVWAQTMAVNQRSRRVMEKLGMRHIRTFHKHFDEPLPGTEHGEVEYAITREEWQARAGS
jgi:RimJ/RimL family protein N-acetyltransferase